MKTMMVLLMLAIGLVGALPVDTGVKGGAAPAVDSDASFNQAEENSSDFTPMASRSIAVVRQPVAAVQPIPSYAPPLTTSSNLAPWPNSGYTQGAYYPGGWNYGYQPYGGQQQVGQSYLVPQFANPQLLPQQPHLVPAANAAIAPITSGVQPVASRFYQPAALATNQPGTVSMTNPKLDNAAVPLNGSTQPNGYNLPAMQPWIHPPIPMRGVAGHQTAASGIIQPIISPSPIGGYNGMNGQAMSGRFTGSLLSLAPGVGGGYYGGGSPYYGGGPYYGVGGSHYGGGQFNGGNGQFNGGIGPHYGGGGPYNGGGPQYGGGIYDPYY